MKNSSFLNLLSVLLASNKCVGFLRTPRDSSVLYGYLSMLQFSSVLARLELVRTPWVKGSVPQDWSSRPHFRGSHHPLWHHRSLASVHLLDDQFITKGFNSGIARGKRCLGQGEWGRDMGSTPCLCVSPSQHFHSSPTWKHLWTPSVRVFFL